MEPLYFTGEAGGRPGRGCLLNNDFNFICHLLQLKLNSYCTLLSV